MRSLLISCPFKGCGQPLLKKATLRPGSEFSVRCYSCGTDINVRSDQGRIELRIVRVPDGYLTDDEENDIVMMRL